LCPKNVGIAELHELVQRNEHNQVKDGERSIVIGHGRGTGVTLALCRDYVQVCMDNTTLNSSETRILVNT